MQVHLDPAGSSGHSLPAILCPLPLYKAESYYTHPGQLVHSIEVRVHGPSQPVRKVSTIEHQHTTTPWDFAHSCGVSTIVTVSTCTLHKDTVLAKGLDIDITALLCEANFTADVMSCGFNCLSPLNIREHPKAVPV